MPITTAGAELTRATDHAGCSLSLAHDIHPSARVCADAQKKQKAVDLIDRKLAKITHSIAR